VALLGILTSVGAARFTRDAEDRVIEARFAIHSVEQAEAIGRQLTRDVSAVESVAAVFRVTPELSRQQFGHVTAHLLARHDSLLALGWDPWVPARDRESWEAALAAEGHPGRIRERNASGELVPAAPRDHYVPVGYVEPFAGNEPALGYDVASEPRRRAALMQAARTGELTFTSGLLLVQDADRDPDHSQGFLAFWPIYQEGETRAPQLAQIRGFVVGVFRVRDVVASALQGFDHGTSPVRVEDVTDPARPNLLYASPGAHVGPGGFRRVESFEQGNRAWRLGFTLSPDELAAQRSSLPLFGLVVGLLITGLVSFYLDALHRRARRIQMLAEERRRLDDKLQQAQKLESLGVLAGGIAHDFNNLLTGILGNADLALLELSPESPAREEIGQIRLASTRAADLTRQMLAYAGRGRFVSEILDLSKVVEEMLHLLESSICKQAALHCDLAPDLPAIEGDPGQIRQVVMNLITNASDALEEQPGLLSLRTGICELDGGDPLLLQEDAREGGGPHVFLEVSDTGCGMDAETRARMFDPFFTTKFPGRGLGLAAMLGIVRSHRGAVRVESEPGRGTTCRVLFPVAERATETDDTLAPDRAWRPGHGTVLVIDDEEQVRRLARRALRRAGFEVLTAADGDEGLAAFRKHGGEIVAVLLDRTMPRLGGVEVLRSLRALAPATPVLLSSGYEWSALHGEGSAPRPDGFLQKPYTARELVEAVLALLER